MAKTSTTRLDCRLGPFLASNSDKRDCKSSSTGPVRPPTREPMAFPTASTTSPEPSRRWSNERLTPAIAIRSCPSAHSFAKCGSTLGQRGVYKAIRRKCPIAPRDQNSDENPQGFSGSSGPKTLGRIMSLNCGVVLPGVRSELCSSSLMKPETNSRNPFRLRSPMAIWVSGSGWSSKASKKWN